MDARLALSRIVLAWLCVLASGCAQLGYYAHLAQGHVKLLAARESIHKILEDSSRDDKLRQQLSAVRRARHFAIEILKLPDNGSYQHYADLRRPYALWNVLATPEFSLNPVESCFPIAGCVAYRAYYDPARAHKLADQYRAQGYDVDIGGVPAFSTLGWFRDPVLNTMMHWSETVLIGTLFHELAHQRLYLADDTAFNESFARFVEQEGLRHYFSLHEDALPNRAQRRLRSQQFTALVLSTRRTLASVYQLPLSTAAMRARKKAAFEQLKADYETLRDTQWNGDGDYDDWFAQELNNASLLPFGLYDEWVPAFSALFQASGHDWEKFYATCRDLGRMDRSARQEQMKALMRPYELQARKGD